MGQRLTLASKTEKEKKKFSLVPFFWQEMNLKSCCNTPLHCPQTETLQRVLLSEPPPPSLPSSCSLVSAQMANDFSISCLSDNQRICGIVLSPALDKPPFMVHGGGGSTGPSFTCRCDLSVRRWPAPSKRCSLVYVLNNDSSQVENLHTPSGYLTLPSYLCASPPLHVQQSMAKL